MISLKTYDEIFTFNNLYKSYLKCIKGSRWKIQNQRFIMNDTIKINKLYNELKDRTYHIGQTYEFDIVERGKPRHISAYTLRDRIVQRCLCDYYLIPLFSKKFIYDCGATLKNRGIYFAKNRTAIHLNKYYKENGSDGYVLLIDLHHYFDSIDHDLLLNLMYPYIGDKEIYNLLKNIIYDNKKSLGLGSQVSQICALFFLNKVDHFIKEKLKIKYYARYMDDLYLIHKDKKYLYKCFKIIKKMINDQKLHLNPSKSRVHYLKNGFEFLKVKWILKDNGKVLKFITTDTFNAMKRKCLKGVDLGDVLPSWNDYVSYFNCHKRHIEFLKWYNNRQK